MVLSVFCGLDLSGEVPVIKPELPGHWEEVSFRFGFRGDKFNVRINHAGVDISSPGSGNKKIKVNICGGEYEIKGEQQVSVRC
ncbi:MAG: glycosyl hydrolase family 65 protein [Bacteroidales bacterium]